ncbi:sensor domain-containing protein [Luteimicrobium sp. NPDC057192]|uniref:sensor domain-containing protein n=1 Tax=Luteimicrobium sp. NPDC057192 TaxID=3346042 RepID=UPI0036353BBF
MYDNPAAAGVPGPPAVTSLDRSGRGLAYGLWAGFLGAAVLGLLYLVVLAVGIVVVGAGLLLLPLAVGWLDRVARVFADRAGPAVGHRLELPARGAGTGSVWHRFTRTVCSPATYRMLLWAVVMGVTGVVVGSLVVLTVFAFARELTVPLWWWAVPPGHANSALGMPIGTWSEAIATTATAPIYLALALWVLPQVAVGQARLCAAVLGCTAPTRATRVATAPAPGTDQPHLVSGGVAPGRAARVERLTPRETEVLALMASGMDNTAIADRLVVSQATVLKHVRSIFGKLDLPPGESGHRRVLAVLDYLTAERSGSAGATPGPR